MAKRYAGVPNFPSRKRPPTEAASTFQAKIAKTAAPRKMRVHASGVAYHNTRLNPQVPLVRRGNYKMNARACLQLGEFCARTDQNQTQNM